MNKNAYHGKYGIQCRQVNQVEKILPRVTIIGQLKETILDVVRALGYSDPEESAPKAGNQFPKSIKSCRTSFQLR